MATGLFIQENEMLVFTLDNGLRKPVLTSLFFSELLTSVV